MEGPGTSTISPFVVYFYFFEMESFASLFIEMQTRLASTYLNDLHEHLSEFPFVPKFLVNDREIDLGMARNEPVNVAILPLWVNVLAEQA
jgi:hypothetical protein